MKTRILSAAHAAESLCKAGLFRLPPDAWSSRANSWSGAGAAGHITWYRRPGWLKSLERAWSWFMIGCRDSTYAAKSAVADPNALEAHASRRTDRDRK